LFLVLHPHHKLEYFKKHNWDATWVDTACQIIHDEFDRSYATLDIQGNDTDMQVHNHEVVSRFLSLGTIPLLIISGVFQDCEHL
jgi:hypothetical protein